MTTDLRASPHSIRLHRAGLASSGLFTLFMAFDIVIKLLRLPVVGETLAGLGWSPRMDFTIGVIELVPLILYLVPRTALLGAILLTAIMGGAIATNLRLDLPLFSHVLFGVYLALLAWGGLWLREPRLRALMPVRR